MLCLGSKKRESLAKVSRVSARVSRMLLLEPYTTVRDRTQRATSERSVTMRVGLVIIEDGIVRIRFSLFFLSFLEGPREKGTKKRGHASPTRALNSTWLR